MLTIARTLLVSILFGWEIPQNVLGFAVFVIVGGFRRGRYERLHMRIFIRATFGISLGMFVFYLSNLKGNKHHEYGHALQSMMLGPLYLLVIGIPSVLRVFYGSWYLRIHKRPWKGYYAGYPEKWADRLGSRMP